MEIDYMGMFRDPRGPTERRENLDLAGATWFLNQREREERRNAVAHTNKPWWLMRNYVEREFEIARPSIATQQKLR